MSFQAYIDNIKTKTGKSPEDFKKVAEKQGFLQKDKIKDLIKMVEIFKTNVHKANDAKKIAQTLLVHFPKTKINFDLNDCDKILRVQGQTICIEKITEFLNSEGFRCEILV
jgi:hypothetical protein